MKHRLTFFFFALWANSIVQGQTDFNILLNNEKAKLDTNTVLDWVRKGQALQDADPDSAMFYYNQAKTLSQQLGYPYGMIKYYLNAGILMETSGKYDTAEVFYKSALKISIETKNTFRVVCSYVNLGAVNIMTNDYETARGYMFQGLELAEKNEYTEQVVIINQNLGAIFNNLGMMDKAIYYTAIANDLAMENEMIETAALTYGNLGNMYIEKKDYKKAIQNIQKGIALSKSYALNAALAVGQKHLANAYMQMGDYAATGSLLDSCLNTFIKLSLVDDIANTYALLSNHWFHQRNFDNAKRYADSAIFYGKKYNLQLALHSGLQMIQKASYANNEIDAGDSYTNAVDSIGKIIFDEKTKKQTLEMESKYQYEKNQNIILGQEANLKRKTMLNYGLLLGLLLVSLLALFMFKHFNNSRKLHQQKLMNIEKENLLAKANAIIEGQQMERTRIAKDLHDNIGASLSSVSILASVASLRLRPNDKALEPIQKIGDTIEEVVVSIKDTVWFILPGAQQFSSVIDRVRQFAEPLCVNKNIQLHIDYAPFDKLDEIPSYHKKHIYLILKEAVNNTLKYANAKSISIHCNCLNNQLIVRYKDDGVGFDMQHNSNGNGIKNMRTRAAEMNGQIGFANDNGAVIELSLPV